MTGRLVRKCLAWFQGHAILCSTCKIAVMKPKACNSSHEPCCVTIYQSSLLVAFCKIYPLQISYLGLEALDKNAWCPCSQTNVFCRIGRLYLQINPHVGTFGSQACLYQDERDWRPRRSFQRVPNRCHRTDAAIWTNLHRDTCEFDPWLSFENCFK